MESKPRRGLADAIYSKRVVNGLIWSLMGGPNRKDYIRRAWFLLPLINQKERERWRVAWGGWGSEVNHYWGYPIGISKLKGLTKNGH